MKKEVTKHFVLLNNNAIGEFANTSFAQLFIETLIGKLATEKNIDIRYVKQTSEIDVPEPKKEKNK